MLPVKRTSSCLLGGVVEGVGAGPGGTGGRGGPHWMVGQRPPALGRPGCPVLSALAGQMGPWILAAFESLCSLPRGRSQAGIWVEGVVRRVG